MQVFNKLNFLLIKLAIACAILTLETSAFALCDDITINATSTTSMCPNSGTITVTISGDDVAHLDLTTAKYAIDPVSGIGYSRDFDVNGGFFIGVPAGNYIITIKAICNKGGLGNEVEITKKSAHISVASGNYNNPDMIVNLANVRKTLNCKVTGMIPVTFYGGRAPYKVTFTSTPFGYAGETVFTTGAEGVFEINSLPDGNYMLTLSDDCNAEVKNIPIYVGKVVSDFITISLPNQVELEYQAVDCKSISLRWTSLSHISSSHELFPYYRKANEFYDIVLLEDSDPTENIGGLSNASGTSYLYDMYGHVALNTLTYKDLYRAVSALPAGGHTAAVMFKVKGTSCNSAPISLSIPRPSISVSKRYGTYTCIGVDVNIGVGSQSFACFPVSIKAIEKGTGTTIVDDVINDPSLYWITVNELPYGTYIFEATGSDGGKFQSEQEIKRSDYVSAELSPLSGCRPDGATGSIRLRNDEGFMVGTKVTVKSAPTGQIDPNPRVLTVVSGSIYPYSSSLTLDEPVQILAGIHVFEIENPCGKKIEITANFPAVKNTYKAYVSPSTCMGTLGYVQVYINSASTFIPYGTHFKYISGGNPNDVVRKDYTINTYSTYRFCPFSENADYTGLLSGITPGTYTFEVTDGYCRTKDIVSVTIPEPYSVKDFGYTTNYTCNALEVYPKGDLYAGTVKVSSSYIYFRVFFAKSFDNANIPSGQWPSGAIMNGGKFEFTRSGIYGIQMQYYSSSSTCALDTFYVAYERPFPRLDLTFTSAYVCSNDNKGYIKLVATGGYGNGPYEYELLGSGLPPNSTGVFDYGAPNERLSIKITDKSPESGSCPVNSFTQELPMLDLTDGSIVYAGNGGEVCEGSTIELNCKSLGNTSYSWTRGNGLFVSTEQFPRIFPATTAHEGWYYVDVIPENCGNTKRDSIFIKIIANPEAPNVNNANIERCYMSSQFSIVTLSEAQAASGHTLKWYLADGTTAFSPGNFNSNIIGSDIYYVSQINNNTGCESSKVKVTVTILNVPAAPSTLLPPAVCYGAALPLVVPNSNADYLYKVYTDYSGGTLIGSQQGTGSDVPVNIGTYNTTNASKYVYVTAVDTKGCESYPRSTVIYSRLQSAVGADIITVNDTVCRYTSATLSASAPGITNPIFSWYNNQYDTNPVHVGSTYVVTVPNSVYYYVGVRGDNLCENIINTRKEVRAITKDPVSASQIIAIEDAICPGNTATLQVTSAIENPIYTWYSSSSSTTPIHTGDTFITPVLNSTTSYWVSVKSNVLCESLPGTYKRIIATVNTTANYYMINVANQQICNNTSATINLTATPTITNPVFRWYTSLVETVPFHIGDSYTTPNLTSNTSYYISVSGDNICENNPSNRKVVEISIFNENVEVGNPGQFCPAQNAYISMKVTSGVTYNIYDSPTGGTLIKSHVAMGDGWDWIDVGVYRASTTLFIEPVHPLCGVASVRTSVRVEIQEFVSKYPDIRIQVCPEAGNMIKLNSFLNSNEIPVWATTWTPVNSSIAINADAEVDAGDLLPGEVYTFKFSFDDWCFGMIERKLYVKTLDERGLSYYPPERVYLCYENPYQVVVQQIMGITEVNGGVWDFSSIGSNPDWYYYTDPYGEIFLNTYSLYVDQKGVWDPVAETCTVKIKYTTPASSCNTPTVYELELIIGKLDE